MLSVLSSVEIPSVSGPEPRRSPSPLLLIIWDGESIVGKKVSSGKGGATFSFLVCKFIPTNVRGRGHGLPSRRRTGLQRLAESITEPPPRLVIYPPHYTTGSGTDPTARQPKSEAAKAFRTWSATLPPKTLWLTRTARSASAGKAGASRTGPLFISQARRR